MRPLLATYSLLCIISCTIMVNPPAHARSLYEFTTKTIEGDTVSLSQYKGKVLLIVNVASRCGHTPQYKDLEQLFKQNRERGFAILAFPANNFGGQEPGTNDEIKDFCETTYGVTFDLFSKISVLGSDQHPLFRYLTSQNPEFAGDIKWNFEKFLISREGRIIGRFRSAVKPSSEELTATLEAALRE